MSYVALYRKFRPVTFADVKGQEAIVRTLKNQIISSRVGHAYLFCGTRGTGKTTIAKIMSKAINCENPIDGSPCGECRSCKNIASGNSMNVIEIDAASNNSVENVREIIEEVRYSPTEGKYKVYIIDEVHMMSASAFNALLKTLEEPPKYVVFILATTEPNKLPITILSRCQRYDFRRINLDIIADRIRELTTAENVEIEDKAVRYIAKMADGSLRDALSLLDQCIAFHFGQMLTYDKVLDVLGAVDTEVFGRLLKEIWNQRAGGCIGILDEIVLKGRDLNQFINDFIWYLRNLMLLKSGDASEEVMELSSENIKRLKEESELLDLDDIFHFIRVLSDLSSQIRYASQKRILTEVTLIRLCKPQMETGNDALLERLRSVEKQLERGVIHKVSVPIAQNDMPAPSVKQQKLEKAVPEEIEEIVRNWANVLNEMEDEPLLKTNLKHAKLSLGGDNRLLIVLDDYLASEYFSSNKENQKRLEAILTEYAGKEIQVEIRILQENERFDDSYVDLTKIIHMDIETV